MSVVHGCKSDRQPTGKVKHGYVVIIAMVTVGLLDMTHVVQLHLVQFLLTLDGSRMWGEGSKQG